MTNPSEQRAASSEQRAACSEQRAASSVQRAACSVQRAACSEFRARSVPILVGSVLLVAALLKAQILFTERSSSGGVFQSMWFQVVLVQAELACGLALWLGPWPSMTRSAAMLLFAGFFGVALSQAIGGARSCACFGAVQLHPWLAVLLDAGILLGLTLWKPRRTSSAGGPSFAVRSRVFHATCPLAASLAFPVVLFAFGSPNAYPRLEVFPDTVDLGNVQQGDRRTFTLRVRNPHDRPVTIDKVTSSCPCLEARAIPWLLVPLENKTVELTLDLGREPEFVGRLLIGFEGETTMRAISFTAHATLTVGPSDSYARDLP